MNRRWTTPLFLLLAGSLALLGASLFGAVLERDGWTPPEGLLMAVFVVLFSYLAFGFSHALVGALLRGCGERAVVAQPEQAGQAPEGRVAVVMPIHNEEVARVFRGARATFESLIGQPEGGDFDLFLLSDSTDPEIAAEEERACCEWVRESGLQGRIHYRRRSEHSGKKAGNVADFCRRWGEDYHAMVVLDADSVMSGATIVELRRRLDASPGTALIQTVPRLVGARSWFGRLQQFANQLYGPVFMDGLAFWQQDRGNFWGHNAIIRLEPFMSECALPELPGPAPFGGSILSHDFVEAGLLCRAGWKVWLAPDLGGSFEEGPQGLVEAATRDRRWCQGNLQHALVLGFRGLHGRTRLHLANGILGYLASPLWLLLLLTGFWVLGDQPGDAGGAALDLLAITAALLFLPKLLCLLDLLRDPDRLRGFGGFGRASLGVLGETLVSALLAPILMMFHSRFVLDALLGKRVAWNPQQRGADGTRWSDAWQVHRGQTAAGLGIAALAIALGGWPAFWLSLPVSCGLLLSVPITVLTSRRAPAAGRWLRTPDEIDSQPELRAAFREEADQEHGEDRDFVAALLDPWLGRTRPTEPRGSTDAAVAELGERLLTLGPASLLREERIALLSDPGLLGRLHLELWSRDDARLAPQWREERRKLATRA